MTGNCPEYITFKSGRWWFSLSWSAAGISRLRFGLTAPDGSIEGLPSLSNTLFPVPGCTPPHFIIEAEKQLRAYFEGNPVTFSLPLDMSGATPFQKAVWRAAMDIPFGEASTYAAVAASAGYPGAARAAGNALGANPIPVIVPCHRVLPASGGIGGFSGGPELKKALLAHEGFIFTGWKA